MPLCVLLRPADGLGQSGELKVLGRVTLDRNDRLTNLSVCLWGNATSLSITNHLQLRSLWPPRPGRPLAIYSLTLKVTRPVLCVVLPHFARSLIFSSRHLTRVQSLPVLSNFTGLSQLSLLREIDVAVSFTRSCRCSIAHRRIGLQSCQGLYSFSFLNWKHNLTRATIKVLIVAPRFHVVLYSLNHPRIACADVLPAAVASRLVRRQTFGAGQWPSGRIVAASH